MKNWASKNVRLAPLLRAACPGLALILSIFFDWANGMCGNNGEHTIGKRRRMGHLYGKDLTAGVS
ncbi:MAG: hypothetical protein H0U76_25375 [Ktedonobacteraceae bacterium]|nr:hypothetical protein [Ktedonobacteraceae bacterium]